MADNLIPHAFFSVRIKPDIVSNSFVRKRVIPALERTHPKQVALLKQKYKKRFSDSKLTETELANSAWYGILNDMITHYSNLLGKDRALSFGLFSGGAHQFIVWDNHHKSLYPSNEFDFSLPFSNDPDTGLFDEDDQVFLKGKLSTSIKNGQRYSTLKIYFYVIDTSERRDPGETAISKNVGILCEIPFFFLRSDRYETFQDERTTSQLLELFALKKEDNDFSPPDFIPTDELGEMYGLSSWTEIGNDYVGVNIR